jgi:biopolymer transport protein ExbD
MGGAAPTPSGKGGKKPLDAAINLVPFIDLLSCCISFLLITAVWTQLARMDVSQKGQGAAGAASEDQQQEKQVQLTVYVDKDGYTFAKSTGETTPIPLKDGEYDYAKLGEILAKAKTDYPDKNDISIKADDTVLYSKIIRTMDIALGSKFPDIGLSDKGGG